MENNQEQMEEKLNANDVYMDAIWAAKDIEDRFEAIKLILDILSDAYEKSIGSKDFSWWTDEEIALADLRSEYSDEYNRMYIEKAKSAGTYKEPRQWIDTSGRNHI